MKDSGSDILNDARAALLALLRRDVDRHRNGEFEELGSEFSTYTWKDLSSEEALALQFWDTWIDEKNHGFPGFSEKITKDMWSDLAENVIESLLYDQLIANHLVLKCCSGGGKGGRGFFVRVLLVWILIASCITVALSFL